MHPYFTLMKKLIGLKPHLGQWVNLFKYGWHFAAGRFEPHCTYSPISFGLHITSRCNLRCPFCYNTQVNKAGAAQSDITLDEFQSLLEHPDLNNALRVAIMGGEPLLHKDLFRMLDMARRHRKLTQITTNSLLIGQRLDEFAPGRPDMLQASIYKDHFDRQAAAIESLRRVCPSLPIVLSGIVTTDKDSWDMMRRIMDLAAELRVRNVYFTAYSPMSAEEASLCYYEDNIELTAHLADFRRQYGRRFRLGLPSPLPRDTRRRFCVAPYTAPYVAKGGVVSPCCEIIPTNGSTDNALTEPFWNNDVFQGFRRDFISRFPVHPRCEHCPASSKGKGKDFYC